MRSDSDPKLGQQMFDSASHEPKATFGDGVAKATFGDGVVQLTLFMEIAKTHFG